LLVTVKPTRGGSLSPRRRICTTQPVLARDKPRPVLRKSRRFRRRRIAVARRSAPPVLVASGGKTRPATGTPASNHLAAARRGHARTKTVAALANESARLIGALHDRISMFRSRKLGRSWRVGPAKLPLRLFLNFALIGEATNSSQRMQIAVAQQNGRLATAILTALVAAKIRLPTCDETVRELLGWRMNDPEKPKANRPRLGGGGCRWPS